MNAIHPTAIAASRDAAHLFERMSATVINPRDCHRLGPEVATVIARASDILNSSSLSSLDLETIRLVLSDESLDFERQRDMIDAKRVALANCVQNLRDRQDSEHEQQLVTVKAAGYDDQQLVAISLAVSLALFSNFFQMDRLG